MIVTKDGLTYHCDQPMDNRATAMRLDNKKKTVLLLRKDGNDLFPRKFAQTIGRGYPNCGKVRGRNVLIICSANGTVKY